MNSKVWIHKALTTCLMSAMIATYSMVALASADRVAGELTVIGKAGDTSFVTVNGEPATSGRTVFPASTISTPEGVRAILNLNKAGKIEIAPNSTFTISFDGAAMGGDLTAGSVTVLNAAKSVGVKTLGGDVVQLAAGETASAEASAKQTTTKSGTSGWLWFGLIFGGALAAIIYAATADNDAKLGGNSVTVPPVLSPVR